MIFDRSNAEAFAAASHDRNPLHLDAGHARRTPFGRPVVYGMASVLAALGEWSGGRPFCMSGLRIRFKLPIYFDEQYELKQDTAEGTVKLVVVRHGVPHTEISFEWVEWSPADEPAAS